MSADKLAQARKRVSDYIERRNKAQGLDAESIHSFHLASDCAVELKLSDLETLLAQVAAPQQEPVGYVYAADLEAMKKHGGMTSMLADDDGGCIPVYSVAPQEPDKLDAQRLDWLDSQGYAYGFEDMHEGNAWEIKGPFANLREAIDSVRKAQP